jgi:16S rRNA (uracil1498-N3)-methyltransferase
LIFADEAGGEPLAAALRTAPAPAAILIGPEGGFDVAERAAIRALPQCRPVSLGPRILRADTAAAVAVGVWQAVSGDCRS